MPVVQAKLTVGEPNDPLEREADRVAAAVVAGLPHVPIVSSGGTHAQRKCTQCEEDADERLSRKPISASGIVDAGELDPQEIRRLPGRSLPIGVRGEMEARFGRDFEGVRIHEGPRATELARRLKARAFTMGEHIFFARGEFSPSRHQGQHLIAHELAHVVQQSGQTMEVIRRAPIEDVAEKPEPRDAARSAAYSLIFTGDPYGASVASESLRSLEPSEFGPLNNAQVAARLLDYIQNGTEPGEVLVSALDLLSADRRRAIAVAINLTSGLTDEILKKFLLVDTWGPIAVERLTHLVEEGGGAKALAKTLANFGRLAPTGTSQASIRSNRETTDTQKHCMMCVEHNVMSIFGGAAEEQMRNSGAARAKKEGSKTRLSDYAAFLMDTGRARFIVDAKFSHEECMGSIVFDPEGARLKKQDPWVFPKLGDVPIYRPDPLAAIENAIRHGADGLYPFIASVEAHHAVTLIAEKSGLNVVVHWNDPGAIAINKSLNRADLGKPQTRESLARKIWDSASVAHSEAEKLYHRWRMRQINKADREKKKTENRGGVYSGVDPRTTLKKDFDPTDPSHVDTVRSLRCSTHGIRIWQLLPIEK